MPVRVPLYIWEGPLPVLNTVELKAGDRLEIGSGIYLFVPLCGENFQW